METIASYSPAYMRLAPTLRPLILCTSLFALGGGPHYRRTAPLARLLADSFARTSLRPPLALALDGLVEQFAPLDS